jgi:hypothetical protein
MIARLRPEGPWDKSCGSIWRFVVRERNTGAMLSKFTPERTSAVRTDGAVRLGAIESPAG